MSARISRAVVPAVAAAIVAWTPWTPSIRADVISVAWSPVVHPDVIGYRVRIEGPEGNVGTWTVAGGETALSVSVLASGCKAHCVHVASLDANGASSSPAVLCGLPDPEIFDVAAHEDDGFRILGDNFAADAQVFLDDGTTPVSSTRLGCGELWIDEAPETLVVVRNPTDGVDAEWTAPSAGYLLEELERGFAILECRLEGGGSEPAVTRFTQTPGLGLAVEADAVGLGTDCAAAVAAILVSDPASFQTLPMVDASALVYVFNFD